MRGKKLLSLISAAALLLSLALNSITGAMAAGELPTGATIAEDAPKLVLDAGDRDYVIGTKSQYQVNQYKPAYYTDYAESYYFTKQPDAQCKEGVATPAKRVFALAPTNGDYYGYSMGERLPSTYSWLDSWSLNGIVYKIKGGNYVAFPIQIAKANTKNLKKEDIVVEYSTDNGATWTALETTFALDYDASDAVNAAAHPNVAFSTYKVVVKVPDGDVVKVRTLMSSAGAAPDYRWSQTPPNANKVTQLGGAFVSAYNLAEYDNWSEVPDSPTYVSTTKTYTVTYVADGVTVSTQTVEEGANATAPEVPAKEGYTGAWDKEATNVTADVTVNAVYTKIPVAPTFSDVVDDKTICEDDKNLIENHDLEAGGSGAFWTGFHGWGWGGTWPTVVSGNAHSGEKSLQIKGDSWSPNGHNKDFALNAETDYMFSTWYKVDNAPSGSDFLIKIYLGDVMKEIRLTADGEWHQLAVNFNTAAETAMHIYYYLGSSAGATLLFDDAYLCKAEDAIAPKVEEEPDGKPVLAPGIYDDLSTDTYYSFNIRGTWHDKLPAPYDWNNAEDYAKTFNRVVTADVNAAWGGNWPQKYGRFMGDVIDYSFGDRMGWNGGALIYKVEPGSYVATAIIGADQAGKFACADHFDCLVFEASADGKNWTAIDKTIVAVAAQAGDRTFHDVFKAVVQIPDGMNYYRIGFGGANPAATNTDEYTWAGRHACERKFIIGGSFASEYNLNNYTDLTQVPDSPTYVPAPKTYTVTYVADGVTVDTQTIVEGGNAVAPEVPAKEGYTGVWDKEANNVTADVTVNAVYTINKFTVTYKADGEVVDTVTVDYGANATAPEVPAKEGYNGAWDKEANNVTADVTVNAVYTIKTYTVTYMADGVVVDTVTVDHGASASAPAVPAKEGYTGAWDKEATNVTADVTVNAVYTEIPVVDPNKLSVDIFAANNFDVEAGSGNTTNVTANNDWDTYLVEKSDNVALQGAAGWWGTNGHWNNANNGGTVALFANNDGGYAIFEIPVADGKQIDTLKLVLNGRYCAGTAPTFAISDAKDGNYTAVYTPAESQSGNDQEFDVTANAKGFKKVFVKVTFPQTGCADWAAVWNIRADGTLTAAVENEKLSADIFAANNFDVDAGNGNTTNVTANNNWDTYLVDKSDNVALQNVAGWHGTNGHWNNNNNTVSGLYANNDGGYAIFEIPVTDGKQIETLKLVLNGRECFGAPTFAIAKTQNGTYTDIYTPTGATSGKDQEVNVTDIAKGWKSVFVKVTFPESPCADWHAVWNIRANGTLVDAVATPTYTVTYMADGVVVDTQTVEEGASAVAPEVPAKEGYTGAWDKEATNVTGDVTVNAVYTIKTYTVTYVADGVTVDTVTVDHGASATAPAVPAKEGYTGAWDKEATNVTGDVTVNAVYTIKTYTVTYVADGVTVKTETVEHGKDATAPTAPAKEGYTVAWDKEATNVTADVTVNAVYTIKTYTVTYVADGATVKTETVEHGKDATAPTAPAKEGYTVAWDKEATNVTADVTVNAVYTIKTYTVTYVADGQTVKTETVEHGKNATAPTAPAKEGYTVAWDKEATNVTADVTVNAVYTIKTYTVTYVADGQTVKTETVEHGKNATAPTAPAKEGYTVAWDKEATNVTADVTVNAVYTIKTYTVTYVADGETVDTVTVEYGKDATAPAVPEKEGYTGAWDKDGKNITADTTITAVYTEIPDDGDDDGDDDNQGGEDDGNGEGNQGDSGNDNQGDEGEDDNKDDDATDKEEGEDNAETGVATFSIMAVLVLLLAAVAMFVSKKRRVER